MTHPYSTARIRASVSAFAIGKAVSAPLTLTLVFVLAWLLDRVEYGRYIAAVAVLEMAVVVGTLGVEWVMQTAVAGVLVHGNAAQLQRVVLVLTVLPCVAYAALAALLAWGAPWVSAALGGVADVELLRLYAAVLLFEGPLRMLRDNLLAVLMQQRAAQFATVLRVLVMAGVVAWGGLTQPDLAVQWVAMAELWAAGCSLLVVVCVLAQALYQQRPRVPMARDIQAWIGWHSVRFAGHAYASLLFMLMVGTDVMLALVARYLGAETTAALGLVVRLFETIRRYLPMDLFWGVLRPSVTGRYESQGRDFAVLMRDAHRMMDANLLAIALVTVLTVAGGDWLVHMAGGARTQAAPGLLLVLLPLLATHTLRRAIELMAYMCGASAAFVRAARLAVWAPLLSAGALLITGQVYAAPLMVWGVDCVLIGAAIRRLRACGHPLRLSVARWWRLVWACASAALLGAGLREWWPGMPGVGLALVLSGAAFTIAAWVLHVVAPEDRQWLRAVWTLRANARGAS